jgi:hypothetical protein
MAQSDPIIRGPWPGGINNRVSEKGMPTGTLRDAINFDSGPDGILSLRAGYSQSSAALASRGALSIGSQILFADGENLRCFDADTNSTTDLAAIAGSGRFAGAVLNEELFFCTENACMRYKAGVLRSWGVPTATQQPVPSIGTGGLIAGQYKCAVTFLNAMGEEGGTTQPVLMTVGGGASMTFALPDPPVGMTVRLYVGPASSSELYLQFEGTGSYTCALVDVTTARLETAFMREPVPGDFICQHNGVLLIADGNTLWMTDPLRPHLRDQANRFFQYAAPIDGVESIDLGVLVLADETYRLIGVETVEVAQMSILGYGGVRGTLCKFDGPSQQPGEIAAWMTQYGVARTDGQGGVVLVSATNFLPELSSHGSSGLVEHNGNQLLVTTLYRAPSSNPLRSADYFEAEILTP